MVSLIAATVVLPGILAHLGPTLDHYGYFAVFGFLLLEDFGVPVPGETILIAAAIYAGAGQLNPVVIGLLGVTAAVLGDNIGFAIGHLVERNALLRYGRFVMLTDQRLRHAEEFFDHHGGKIIVIARFVEGLRQANGIVAGLTGMKWLRFLFFNVIGAVLWVGCWLTVGVTAGSHITAVYNGITHYSLIAAIAAALIVLAVFLLRRAKRRRSVEHADALD